MQKITEELDLISEQKQLLYKLVDLLPNRAYYECYSELIDMIAFYHIFADGWSSKKEQVLEEKLKLDYPFPKEVK